MVEISDFVDADLDGFTPTMADLEGVEDWRAMLRGAVLFGPAWTARIDGRIIGCAGLATLWRGRAQAWCALDRDVPKRAWLGIHRAVVDRLTRAQADGLRRIEGETLLGFQPGRRWLAMLGFEEEGLARAYGPRGEDFLRFARVATHEAAR